MALDGNITLEEGGVNIETIEGVVTQSSLVGAMAALKDLLAESITLWDDLYPFDPDGEGTPTAARIHLTQYEAAAGAYTRPFIVLSRTASERGMSVASGNQVTYGFSGSIEMRIERNIPEEYQADSGEAERDFMNFIDGLLDDMMTLAGTPGYLIVNGWEIIDGPFQFAEDRSEEFIYGIRIRVNWGLV